jgi:hypothetical protein
MLVRSGGPTVISLHVFYRSQGIQWPLRDDDVVFVRHARTGELLFVTTGEYVMTLIRHEMDKVALQRLTTMEMERKDGTALNVDHGQPLPFGRKDREQLRANRRRKPPTKMAGVILLALSLSGCLSTNPTAWTQAPDETTRAKRDIYECQAETTAAGYRAAAFGGAVVPLVSLFQRRGLFNDCMAARGWRQD